MTAPRAGETDRGVGASGRSVRAPAAVPAITILLLGGLALRLIIAYVLLPGSGFESDIGSFTAWALRLAEVGPGGFYDQAVFSDYPPGYLYVLWAVGIVAQALAGLAGADATAVATGLIKLPPILADVAVAALLYALAGRWLRDAGRLSAARIESVAVGVAALYLLNPVTVYDSAIWGQVDAVGALVMLAAVACLAAGFSEGAAGLAVLAGLVKPQFGIVLAPLVAVVLLRRHLLRPGSGPRWSGGPRFLRDWVDSEHGLWRLVSSAATGLIVLVVLLLPFGLDLPGFVNEMISTAGGYPWLSVNAYNPWALVGSAGRGSLADGGGWSPDSAFETFTPAEVAILGPLPGVAVGSLLLAAGFVVGLAQAAWRDERRSLVLAASFLSLAFFLLPTRVHERYLFPIFAFLPLLVLWDRRARLVTAVLAAASFVNLHGVLTIPLYGTPNVDDLPLGPEFRSFPFVLLSVAGHVAVFGYLLWQLDPIRALLGRAREMPEPAPLEPRSAVATLEPEATSTVELAAPPPVEAGVTLPVAAAPPAATDLSPDALAQARPSWEEELPLPRRRAPRESVNPAAASLAPSAADPSQAGSAAGPGIARSSTDPTIVVEDEPEGRSIRTSLIEGLRRRLGARPARLDRTGELAGEPTGRLGRLDLLLVVLVVLASLSLRTWRLDEPHGMHFDEVYHARTATEFLQHWRYGMPHDIYEFTHPHLAKYLIAAGIVVLGGDRVSGTSTIGAQVRAAAVERRWSPPSAPAERDGDRLWVATSAGLRAYDLAGISGPLSWPGTQAVALALDSTDHRLYLADSDGALSSLETTAADAARDTGSTEASVDATDPLGNVVGTVERLAVSQDGGTLYAIMGDDRVVAVDTDTGAVESEATRAGASALVPLKPAERLVADPLAVSDVGALAARLAQLLDVEAGPLRQKLAGSDRVRIADHLSSDERSQIDEAIAAGELPGVELESAGSLAVADGSGVAILDGATLEVLNEIPLSGAATGMVLTDEVDKPTLYVATGRQLDLVEVPDDAEARTKGTVRMPAQVHDVIWDPSSNLVHALGKPSAPGPRDGIEDPAATVYVIQPHANAVFADAALAETPQALVLDSQPERPSEDRQRIMVLAPDGNVAVIDAGAYSFAWRFPGVLAGALMAGLIYLLGRVLFRRRSVALLAAALVLVDGMFFAQSRIAMNDSYVALFIVAAYTLFAPIYLGRWRGASALLVGMPLVGVLLGLALATKWVGAYAIGGVILLILLRSALGRLIALGGLVLMTGVLGYLAITPAPVDQPRVNYLFLVLMLALTALLAAAIVLRPVRFTLQEVRFAIGAPAVFGALLCVAGIVLGPRLPLDGPITTRLLLSGAVISVVLAGAAYGLFRLAGRFGYGPLAEPSRDPEDPARILDAPAPAPSGWLLPGYRWGLPWLFALVCLAVVPLAVYVVHYVPWVELGNQLVAGVPAGREGKQTLLELQISMYDYHNDLRATHAAASPWWAWPLDLKPVWFYQEGLANGTTALIYDSGNLVAFWLTLAALPWAAWQAWRRRSLALTLLVIGFCAQWLPWARIDRATFQYHVYTSLPFGFLCLAYFLADLWHGPSRRTWQLARVAAALAIVGAPLLWIGRVPLCMVAGTLEVHPTSQACGAVLGQAIISERLGWSLIALFVGLGAAAWQLRPSAGRLERPPIEIGGRLVDAALVWAAVTIGLTAIAVFVAQARFGEATLLALPIGSLGPYVAAFLLLVPLAVASWHVLGARDPRNFVVVAVATAALWFVLWYPNLAALPLPNGLASVYQGVLPTYNYDFQFAVNTDQAFKADLFEPVRLLPGLPGLPAVPLLLAVCTLTAVAVMYAAYAWRIELAVRRAAASLPPGTAPEGPAAD